MILVIFQCAPNFDYSEMRKYTFYPLSAVLAEHYYSPLTCRELLTQWHSATSQQFWHSTTTVHWHAVNYSPSDTVPHPSSSGTALIQSPDMPWTTHPVTQCHIPEDLNHQQHHCDSLESCKCDKIWPEYWRCSGRCVNLLSIVFQNFIFNSRN
jgi:hypothetical protein